MRLIFIINMNTLNLTTEQLSQLANIIQGNISEKSKNSEWKENLKKDERGKIINHIDNYVYFLENSPKYKGQLKYNDFSQQREIFGRLFTDGDVDIIYNDCEREINLYNHSKIDSALGEIFMLNKYNPAIDYLKNCVWDHKERLSSLFIDLLEADNTPLNREMTKKWFIAAVKRIMKPGCKFDNMIVLQGEQGIGKSSICELLSNGFCSNISLGEIGNKDIIDKLNKTWIAIIDELDTFNKKEMSSIKTFLSNSSDNVRLAYARNTTKFDRHCIFIGSTNDETFLRDSTSSVERRFWVIKCNKVTMDDKIRKILTKEYVEQIWGEAMHYYNEDPDQYLDIDKSLRDDFSRTMREFKTYTDDKAIDYATEILNKEYKLNSNGEFYNHIDCLEQFRGDRLYENSGQKINKMPMSYLLFVMKEIFKTERTNKHIALALSQEWEYKNIKYNGKTYKGLIRKQNIHERDLFE